MLEPPLCVRCRGDGCQGREEERGAGQSAAGKHGRWPVYRIQRAALFPSAPTSSRAVCSAGLLASGRFGSGWRMPFGWLRLVCGTGSTTQPWLVNLCLVPDRHWSCLCQKLPPFWKSLPSGTPCFSTLSPSLALKFGMVPTSPCSEHGNRAVAAWAPALPQLSLSVPPGWHLFIQKGHKSASRSKKDHRDENSPICWGACPGQGSWAESSSPTADLGCSNGVRCPFGAVARPGRISMCSRRIPKLFLSPEIQAKGCLICSKGASASLYSSPRPCLSVPPTTRV